MENNKNPTIPEWTELAESPKIPHVPPLDGIPVVLEHAVEIAQIAQNNHIVNNVLDNLDRISQAISNVAYNVIESIGNAIQAYQTSVLSSLAEQTLQLFDALSKIRIPTISDEEAEQLVESNRLWGQYGWTNIPSMPLSMYDDPPESIQAANKKAMQYCSAREMEKVFDHLREWNINHKDLESAIFCYQNKQYKACALLLCGLIEGKIIRLRKESGRPVGANAVAKLKKEYEDRGEKLLVEAMFAYNLLSYLETLFARANGFKDEPGTLNRNYIGHGMNCRAVRKRDCIQLFLALNNLMHFFDLGLQY